MNNSAYILFDIFYIIQKQSFSKLEKLKCYNCYKFL